MNKKGFIHTLEATIAVIIILSLIIILTPVKEKELQTPNRIEQSFSTIFSEISVNYTFRDCLLSINSFGNLKDITEPCIGSTNIFPFIEKNIPYGYNYLAEICNTATTCTSNLYNTLPVDQSVYAESTFIASDPARIFRIYFWEKN